MIKFCLVLDLPPSNRSLTCLATLVFYTQALHNLRACSPHSLYWIPFLLRGSYAFFLHLIRPLLRCCHFREDHWLSHLKHLMYLLLSMWFSLFFPSFRALITSWLHISLFMDLWWASARISAPWNWSQHAVLFLDWSAEPRTMPEHYRCSVHFK